MTDDRSLERAARSWLEEGPTQAPDRPVEAALRVIQATTQERDLRIPWRFPQMTLVARSALIAAIGVIAVGGALYLITPRFGPGGPAPTASPVPATPAPTRLMAGPLEIGRYVGPTLQVADIVAAVNADASLTPAQRTRIIDVLMEIRDKSTWTPAIELRGGQLTQRHTVDGVTQIGSAGRYAFPDDRTLVYTVSSNGADAVIRFQLMIEGDSFTLRRTTPAVDAEDEFAADAVFESGPFRLER
jgi:hypothetical protein